MNSTPIVRSLAGYLGHLYDLARLAAEDALDALEPRAHAPRKVHPRVFSRARARVDVARAIREPMFDVTHGMNRICMNECAALLADDHRFFAVEYARDRLVRRSLRDFTEAVGAMRFALELACELRDRPIDTSRRALAVPPLYGRKLIAAGEDLLFEDFFGRAVTP